MILMPMDKYGSIQAHEVVLDKHPTNFVEKAAKSIMERKMEDGSRKTENGMQKAKGRRQKAEGKRQKAEGRRQNIEDGSRKTWRKTKMGSIHRNKRGHRAGYKYLGHVERLLR